jgi:hypothetical protein
MTTSKAFADPPGSPVKENMRAYVRLIFTSCQYAPQAAAETCHETTTTTYIIFRPLSLADNTLIMSIIGQYKKGLDYIRVSYCPNVIGK